MFLAFVLFVFVVFLLSFWAFVFIWVVFVLCEDLFVFFGLCIFGVQLFRSESVQNNVY